jgi:phytoene dehydrogenase-like protein
MALHDVVIVGAGLAGLTCARALQAKGADCVVLEAAEAVGGRVRTEEREGFRLDRGFQVLLTAYPTARRWLELDKLALGEFAAGARVATPDGPGLVGDPWREPGRLAATLRAPVGSLADKLRIGALGLEAGRGGDEAAWARERGRRAGEFLAARGFSAELTERFLRPWLGGIFLERELETPAAMLYFVYRMFARGRAALPAGGMQRIPEQLAAGLREGTVRTGARVISVERGAATLAGGEIVSGREVVVATEADVATSLVPELGAPPPWRSVTCVQWDAPESPLRGDPILWLNGSGRGLVNNVVVPSDVAKNYAPAGRALVSATVIGASAEAEARLEAALRVELAEHFGAVTRDWRSLTVQRVRRALPALREPGAGRTPTRLRPGLWVCGDHRASASIEGAMASGEALAEALAGRHAPDGM